MQATPHRALAREAARQGIVLLKNDRGILPLRKDLDFIAVIGPNADAIYNQLGDYTAPQPPGAIVTPRQGIAAAVLPRTVVRYARGCAVRDRPWPALARLSTRCARRA